jgi:hypothetical protein
MTRRGRGPTKLNDEQRAILEVVRQRRIDRDNAEEELLVRIEQLRESFVHEQETALRSAIQKAVEARIPIERLKAVTNISDHRTFRNRFLLDEVTVEPIRRDDGTSTYYYTHLGNTLTLVRLLDLKLDLKVTLGPDGDLKFNKQDVYYVHRQQIWGVVAAIPTYDVPPEPEYAAAWSEFEAEAKKVLAPATETD